MIALATTRRRSGITVSLALVSEIKRANRKLTPFGVHVGRDESDRCAPCPLTASPNRSIAAPSAHPGASDRLLPRRASLVERLLGYLLQFVARGMCNKLATIGQSDYESELVHTDAGPMKQNLHLARGERKLTIVRNVDGEAKDAQPRLV